jgi:hypothetical protein
MISPKETTMNLFAALKGKKTYILSGLTVLASVAGVITRQMTPIEAVTAIAGATGLSTMRKGSKDDADRAANTVIDHVGDAAAIVAAIAPVVAATMPGAAKAAGAIGAIAGELEHAAPAA